MTLNITTACQILAWLVAWLDAIVDVLPTKWRVAVFVISSGASIALHQLAGRKNPDGTPASIPYYK